MAKVIIIINSLNQSVIVINLLLNCCTNFIVDIIEQFSFLMRINYDYEFRGEGEYCMARFVSITILHVN